MNAKHNDSSRDSIADAAALWLARRDRGLSKREEKEFSRWCDADPRHRAEFAQVDSDWGKCDRAKAVPRLAAMAAELDRATVGQPPARPRLLWAGLLATAAALAMIVGLSWPRLSELLGRTHASPNYEVLASAAKKMILADGSVAMVRSDSEVQVEYTVTERRVVLVRGEAHFNVEKNPERPFIVRAGSTSVRAVGTAFDVQLDPKSVKVIVTEGTVQVGDGRVTKQDSPQPLVSAGQSAVIDQILPEQDVPRVEITQSEAGEIEHELAWKETRLVFARTTLAAAVSAFNTHATNSGVRLVIGSPSLEKLELGGTFRAANIEAFVRLLEKTFDLRVEHRGDELVLLPAH